MTDLTHTKIYEELSTNIRTTDDVSFKLMGIVPLVSGTGLLGLLLSKDVLTAPVVVLLSLFAAVVTLGLFRWELRNIQDCKWFIRYVATLEQKAFEGAGWKAAGVERPEPPQGIGKQKGESIVYAATIFTWLAFPAALALFKELDDPWLKCPYAVASLVIALATLVSVFAPITQDRVSLDR